MLGDLKWILHNCIIYNGGMIITTDLVRVPSIATPVLFAFDRSCKQAHRGRKKPDTDVAARDERDASVRGLLSQQHLEKPWELVLCAMRKWPLIIVYKERSCDCLLSAQATSAHLGQVEGLSLLAGKGPTRHQQRDRCAILRHTRPRSHPGLKMLLDFNQDPRVDRQQPHREPGKEPRWTRAPHQSAHRQVWGFRLRALQIGCCCWHTVRVFPEFQSKRDQSRTSLTERIFFFKSDQARLQANFDGREKTKKRFGKKPTKFPKTTLRKSARCNSNHAALSSNKQTRSNISSCSTKDCPKPKVQNEDLEEGIEHDAHVSLERDFEKAITDMKCATGRFPWSWSLRSVVVRLNSFGKRSEDQRDDFKFWRPKEANRGTIRENDPWDQEEAVGKTSVRARFTVYLVWLKALFFFKVRELFQSSLLLLLLEHVVLQHGMPTRSLAASHDRVPARSHHVRNRIIADRVSLTRSPPMEFIFKLP